MASEDVPQSSEQGRGKIFLGGLSWETNEDKLKEHFAKYGSIQEVIVMRDRITGKPRGFGFITFDSEEAAEKACNDTHWLDGRMIDAKPSVPQDGQQRPRSKKIFVGGLAPETTQAQFKEHFERFGPVFEAQIMVDHTSNRSRGFGFITFDDEASVHKVFAAGSIHEIAGKRVEVKNATPKGSGPQGRTPMLGVMGAPGPGGVYPPLMGGLAVGGRGPMEMAVAGGYPMGGFMAPGYPMMPGYMPYPGAYPGMVPHPAMMGGFGYTPFGAPGFHPAAMYGPPGAAAQSIAAFAHQQQLQRLQQQQQQQTQQQAAQQHQQAQQQQQQRPRPQPPPQQPKPQPRASTSAGASGSGAGASGSRRNGGGSGGGNGAGGSAAAAAPGQQKQQRDQQAQGGAPAGTPSGAGAAPAGQQPQHRGGGKAAAAQQAQQQRQQQQVAPDEAAAPDQS